VSFVICAVVACEVPFEFVAVTVTVIVPSFRPWAFTLVKWTRPAPSVAACGDALTSWLGSPSLSVRVIMSVAWELASTWTSKLSWLTLAASM
jgi:hypothetical protein